MTKQSQGSMILVGAIAGGVGFVAFVALMVLGEYRFSPALFLALVVAGAAAVALFVGFHKTEPQKMPEARDRRSLVPSSDGRLGDRTVESGSAGVAQGSAGVEPGSAGKVRGGTLLAGEEELATRKGDWRYERPGAEAGAVGDVENAHANPSARIARDEATPDEGAAARQTADHGTAHDSAETQTRPADGGAAPVPAKAEPVQPAATGDVTTAEAGTTDETIMGTEPEHMSAPREGGPDDLKRIKGVGPKLEEMLNRMGFYHYDQVAGWSRQEVAWVDEHLEGFKGRVSRDNWVDQARILADGGETEFSRRADET